MLGNEPIESQIPMDRSDLLMETQIVFDLYDKLPTRWDGFSGQYLGKDLVLLPVLFKEFDVDDLIRKYAWSIIPFIDSIVGEDIAKKIKSKSKGKTPNG